MAKTDTITITNRLLAAFPPSHKVTAEKVAGALLPHIDLSYGILPSSLPITVSGRPVKIPYRIHFPNFEDRALLAQSDVHVAIHCLLSRSTDGYRRQQSLRRLIGQNAPWVVPYVVMLAGEYVVEIAEDLVASIPTLSHSAYANFVRENRAVMRTLRAKATSYWGCYYRAAYPVRTAYPGLAFLYQLESWAS